MINATLVYREQNATGPVGQPTVLALHGWASTSAQLLPLTAALGHVRTVAVEAPLPLSPFTARVEGGQEWFLWDDGAAIDPATFGDSLYQVEQFLLELGRVGGSETESLLFLLGFDQGGLLALTLACLWPERVSGVIAIEGYLPEIPGWSVPSCSMNGMPVLLVRDTEASQTTGQMVEKSCQELKHREADVNVVSVEKAKSLPSSLQTLVCDWLRRIVSSHDLDPL